MRPEALETSDTLDTATNDPTEDTHFSGTPAWLQHAIREIQADRDPDHEQFELIFRQYEPRCRRLLRALGLGQDLDDLVQRIMLRIYRGIPSFRLEASFDTWFRRIVKNSARNAIRDRNTQKARAETSLDTLLEPEPESDTSYPEPETDDPGPLDLVLGKERETELYALLENLPPKMSQSMLLHYIHGYRQAEVAKLQGTSVNTVKKQLADGRKRIRPLFRGFAELFNLLMSVLLLAG